MKKIFLLAGIALLAFSCSSDNNEEEEGYTPPKVRTEYEVDYKISNEEIESYPLGNRKTRTFVLDRTGDIKLGNLGVIVHYPNSMERGYQAYDLCCPIHWEDDDPLKHKLTVLNPDFPTLLYAYCKVGEFEERSSFSLWDGLPSDGYAREKNISLVKYKIDQYPEFAYPYPEAEGRHITNPKYKK